MSVTVAVELRMLSRFTDRVAEFSAGTTTASEMVKWASIAFSSKKFTRAKMITTGGPGFFEVTAKNTSRTVIRNPKFHLAAGVMMVSPKVMPDSMIPGQSITVKFRLDGGASFSDKVKFSYDFVKVETS